MNCKEDTVFGADDVHGMLYMLLFISLIRMAVPQPLNPGFLDGEKNNCGLDVKLKEHEHWYLITPKSTLMLLFEITRPSQLSSTLPEKEKKMT